MASLSSATAVSERPNSPLLQPSHHEEVSIINIDEEEPKSLSEIDALLQECTTAKTPSEKDRLLATLQKLADAIPNTRERRRDEIALFLIRNIGTGTNPALDKCLDACGVESTLGACSQVFLDAASMKIESSCPLETSLRTVKRLLLTLPETDGANEPSGWATQELDGTSTTNSGRRDEILRKASIESIVSMALLLPSQIANACHFQKFVLPVWSVRSRYIPRLVECALARAKDNEGGLYLQSLFPKVIRGGGSDEVAVALYHYYHKYLPNVVWFQNTVFAAMSSISTPRDCATLLRSILRYSMAQEQCPETQSVQSFCQEAMLPYLKIVCLPILQSKRDIRKSFVQLSILSSTSCSSRNDMKSDRIFCHCVALLLSSCKIIEKDGDNDDDSDSSDEDFALGKPSSVLERHLTVVSSCWSEKVFVQRTDWTLQRHVTNFIVSAIPMLDQENKNPMSLLAATTLSGVTLRLETSIMDLRRDGMRVGEALAVYMDQPLKFDELDDERVTDEQASPLEKQVASENLPSATSKSGDDERREAAESDGASNGGLSDDDSIWDDADQLVPYNLDDDEEDLRETAAPVYLRDCLDMLRTPDTNDMATSLHEIGLKALSSLVRSKPVDLPDLTQPLCLALLSMENNFDLPEFNENLASGLLSLLVMQPILAGEYIINEFYGGDRGLSNRLLILRTLEEAACELSGEKALREDREKRKSDRSQRPQRVTGNRRLVPDSNGAEEISASADRAVATVESRTRRWGKSNRQTERLTVVNKFGPVAAPWFYAMIAGFMKHKDNSVMWGGANGARLLANFLIALATIVECSGFSPGTDILARDLCEFAWSFRTVEVPEVRTAVLVAIANALAVLRDEALMSVLYSLGELPEFLRGVALEDSDANCRAIAKTISSNVSQLLEGMMESRSIEA